MEINIRKNKTKTFASSMLLIFLFCIYFSPGNGFLGVAYAVFAYMVYEDFKYQTIDIRCIAALFLALAVDSSYRLDYSFYVFPVKCAAGFLFFRLLYLALTIFVTLKYHVPISSAAASKLADPEQGTQQTPEGFLPFLALGVAVMVFVQSFVPLPGALLAYYEAIEILGNEFLALLSVPHVFIICISLLLLLWMAAELLYDYYQKRYLLCEAFGTGDIFVCAIGIAYLGAASFIVVFYISIALILLKAAGVKLYYLQHKAVHL